MCFRYTNLHDTITVLFWTQKDARIGVYHHKNYEILTRWFEVQFEPRPG